MKIYTIGFTQKSAETFFERLRTNGIQQLVDIRVNPHGQLSGFARQEDLPYFLRHLSDGCDYVYRPELAQHPGGLVGGRILPPGLLSIVQRGHA